ncbi:MAG: ribonuclease P protein component [Bacteroidales bacterium]|nr:ribonuclease P protein component [Bacteroidales bacterium]
MDAALPKSERLCGLKAVGELFQTGKSASAGCLRCKYLLREDGEVSRIVVSVPKRSFKRAVKRNLLKRRIRESYRRQKALLGPGVDILFIYTSVEVLPYEVIYADMATLLQGVFARGMEVVNNQGII